jgi:hypothetical protein
MAVMLLLSSVAWVAMHRGDLLTWSTGMWLALGLLGAGISLRAAVKLRNVAARTSFRGRG